MKKHRILGFAAAAAAGALTPVLAHAQSTMTYQYFTVQNSAANPDFFNKGIDGNTVAGLVNTTLQGGLPTVSSFGSTYSGASGPITQTSGTGQLLWWTANGTSITTDGSGTIPVPFTGINQNFFPSTGGGTDNSAFRTALFTGTINVTGAPATYSFTLGSDDDAWLFIDNQLVGDDGGIKALNGTVFNTTSLGVGPHTVDIFFADRHTVQSGIEFNPQFAITATPEPASLSLVATGLVGVFGVVRRKRKLFV